jgi:hypothetical protein
MRGAASTQGETVGSVKARHPETESDSAFDHREGQQAGHGFLSAACAPVTLTHHHACAQRRW